MKNISIFQLVFMGIFLLAFLGGMTVLFVTRGVSKEGELPPARVLIWGVLSQDAVGSAINAVRDANPNLRMSYVQKGESSFNEELVEAIATGRGPDVILVRQDSIFTNRNKTVGIPFEVLPARTFRDSFIESSEVLLTPSGYMGLPFAIDPLVMYWNRDMFSRVGIVNPPEYWDEVLSITSRLTTKDSLGAIAQSAVGIGEYTNIKNAKEILSTMFIQAGSKITAWNANASALTVDFSRGSATPESVLSFYTQFSDSRKSINTWSRALPDSESMFLGNRLAMYFGFASEFSNLKTKSPNLNFDVAFFPQSRNGSVEGSFSRLYSFMILRTASSIPGAVQGVVALTSKEATDGLISVTGLPSVRKDSKPSLSDPFKAVFAQSAITARFWIDPNRNGSEFIFREMVESVTSGFSDTQGALGKAIQQLTALTK